MTEELINECKKLLEDNLVSIIKFGTEGQPNNILIILKKIDIQDLDKIKPTILKHSKKTKVVPILFTEAGLQDGVDVFPLEFLDIKYPHEVLIGEDIINKIKFDKNHVRRQLEFELRSKLIHLRENYIWIKKSNELRSLLKSAIPTLMPLFYGMLFLKDIKPPSQLESLYKLVNENYNVDTSLFREIRLTKIKDDSLSGYIDKLMRLLQILINQVDKMTFK